MAGISQKIFPPEELRKQVNIKVPSQKMQIYPRFKELVTEILGSDVCFVTTSLWEVFLNAMDQIPPNPADPVEMKFMRQNVQINLGCQILYQPTKARRYPPRAPGTGTPFHIERDKNPLLPEFLDQWPKMSEKSKKFWLQRFQERGIIPAEPQPAPPSISTPAPKFNFKKILLLLGQSIAFGTILFKGSLRAVSSWLKKRLRKKQRKNPFVI